MLKNVKIKKKLIQILENPKSANKLNFNEKEKYCLNLLLKLGRLKLKLHHNAKFVDDLKIFAKFIAKKFNISIN